MAFDFNEARQIIEEAKKRGLISDKNAAARPGATSAKPAAKITPAPNAVIPDWLQKSIEDPSTPGSFQPQ